MNRAELILKIAYSSSNTLPAILKTRSAARLARCLLPAFLCALKESRLGTRQRKLTFDVRCTNILTPNVASFKAECNIFFNAKWNSAKSDNSILNHQNKPRTREEWGLKVCLILDEAIHVKPLCKLNVSHPY